MLWRTIEQGRGIGTVDLRIAFINRVVRSEAMSHAGTSGKNILDKKEK